jgi:hypothetical protein
MPINPPTQSTLYVQVIYNTASTTAATLLASGAGGIGSLTGVASVQLQSIPET